MDPQYEQWEKQVVRLIQMLEVDVFDQSIDENVLRSCFLNSDGVSHAVASASANCPVCGWNEPHSVHAGEQIRQLKQRLAAPVVTPVAETSGWREIAKCFALTGRRVSRDELVELLVRFGEFADEWRERERLVLPPVVQTRPEEPEQSLT